MIWFGVTFTRDFSKIMFFYIILIKFLKKFFVEMGQNLHSKSPNLENTPFSKSNKKIWSILFWFKFKTFLEQNIKVLQNCGKLGKNSEISLFYKQKSRGRIISQQRVKQIAGPRNSKFSLFYKQKSRGRIILQQRVCGVNEKLVRCEKRCEIKTLLSPEGFSHA